MKYACDLHIHSALSACSSKDMTPNNIVNMSIVAGLDIIAVTDHNSAGNLRAVQKVASSHGLSLLPGIEMETREEIHLLCYFPTIDQAEEMDAHIRSALPPILNREDIFGEQRYMDAKDRIRGKETQMLLTAADISFEKAVALCRTLGGAPVPAHIDRSSYSVLSQLGFLPEDIPLPFAELSKSAYERPFSAPVQKAVATLRTITGSDAHILPHIGDPVQYIDLEEKSAQMLVNHLLAER